jgi:hypothetical protein
MPTFSELQIELKKLQNRKAILTYLVEHIDDKFLAASGEEAKNKLLGTDGLPVPEEAFEILVDNTLNSELEQTDVEIQKILSTDVGPKKIALKPEGDKK